jgi:hypothetical protein
MHAAISGQPPKPKNFLLKPLVFAPIRDLNDVIVMQTAIIGEADVLCTNEDFFQEPARAYLTQMAIEVLDDVTLMQRLRSQSSA